MGWLVTFLVGITIIYFAIMSPAFRVFLAVAVVGGGVGIWWWIDSTNREYETRRAVEARKAVLKSSLIDRSKIEVTNFLIQRLSPDSTYFTLSGRVKNTADRTLAGVGLRVILKDCPQTAACEVVGDEAYVIRITVPPQQTRSFDNSITMRGVPPGIRIFSEYDLTSTIAE